MKLKTIGTFIASFIALALPSCKPNDSEASGDQTSGKAESTQSNSLYDLEKQVEELATKHAEVYEDPEVVAANQIMNQAYKEYNDARSIHPELKPLFDKQEADKNTYVNAQVKGDESAKKTAMKAYADSRAAYEKKSLEVKDLDPFRERVKKTEQDYKNTRFKYLKAIPEAKALIEKIESLSK